MPACHAGGRRFEPVPGRQLFLEELDTSWRGSTVEQLICNQQVGGSIPLASSSLQDTWYGGIPEWLKGADCKSVS